jgi:hypothetical protein
MLSGTRPDRRGWCSEEIGRRKEWLPTSPSETMPGKEQSGSAPSSKARSWAKVPGPSATKNTGKFMDQKKAPAKKKFKGVRREKGADADIGEEQRVRHNLS